MCNRTAIVYALKLGKLVAEPGTFEGFADRTQKGFTISLIRSTPYVKYKTDEHAKQIHAPPSYRTFLPKSHERMKPLPTGVDGFSRRESHLGEKLKLSSGGRRVRTRDHHTSSRTGDFTMEKRLLKVYNFAECPNIYRIINAAEF